MRYPAGFMGKSFIQSAIFILYSLNKIRLSI
jgi:hypothetical protein